MTQQQNTTVVKPNWQRDFFTVWGGQAFSLLGSQLVQFALIWWLTETTGSALVLTTAMLVGILPQVVLGPLAGALIDRWSRRAVMMVADSLIAAVTVGLALLFWSGQVQIWHVYLLMFLRAAAGGFHWPAMQASTSLMVPDKQLARVQGLNQMLQGLLGIGAAPLGALLLEVLPMQGILAIDVITALLAVTPLVFIAIPQPAKSEVEQASSVWSDVRIGLRYVWGWPGLVLIAVMATLINFLLNPVMALMPLLVTNHFGGQALHLAALESAWGVGMLAGGLVLSAWGGFRRRIYTSLMGLVIMGVGTMVVGLAPSNAFPLAVLMFFWAGVGNPLTNGPLLAAVQSVVAPEMQGRVFTLIMSAASAMTPLGLIIAGPLAEVMGVRLWFVLAGVLTILMGIGAMFVPAILHFEDGRVDQAAPGVEPAAAVAPGD